MLTIGNLPRDMELLHDNENKTTTTQVPRETLLFAIVSYIFLILCCLKINAQHIMKAAFEKKVLSKWMQSLAVLLY